MKTFSQFLYLLFFLSVVSPFQVALAANNCPEKSASAKEIIQRYPLIFTTKKTGSEFTVDVAYKGIINDGDQVSIIGSSDLDPNVDYVVFASKNPENKIKLDGCGLTFKKTSVSSHSLSARLLGELEVFRAKIQALMNVELAPANKNKYGVWTMEIGKILEEYHDYERALLVYREQMRSKFKYEHRHYPSRFVERAPPHDPFEHYKINERRRPHTYGAIRDELTQYAIVLNKLGRYEDVLLPLEMIDGGNSIAQQLYFETVLKTKGKQYLYGQKFRLGQLRDMPNYEVKNTDLSDIQLTFYPAWKVTFENVDFSNTNFSVSKFHEVTFKGCDFTGANLEYVEFQNAQYDDKTIWPVGFEPKAHELTLMEDE